MFKKILVCLDGSKIAESVIPYVREQASATGSEVVLLQVVTVPTGMTLDIPGFPAVPFYTASLPKQLKQDYESAEAYLKQTAAPLKEAGIKVESEVAIGPPGPTIVSYANQKNIDLIVVASHGHSGLRKVLVGSTAEHVIREAGLPILIIRPK